MPAAPQPTFLPGENRLGVWIGGKAAHTNPVEVRGMLCPYSPLPLSAPERGRGLGDGVRSLS
ncbi:MAG: hypothetical protein ACUVXG_09345, partial [Anaerolineae bacterium]